jgi:hypothetical protein
MLICIVTSVPNLKINMSNSRDIVRYAHSSPEGLLMDVRDFCAMAQKSRTSEKVPLAASERGEQCRIYCLTHLSMQNRIEPIIKTDFLIFRISNMVGKI